MPPSISQLSLSKELALQNQQHSFSIDYSWEGGPAPSALVIVSASPAQYLKSSSNKAAGGKAVYW